MYSLIVKYIYSEIDVIGWENMELHLSPNSCFSRYTYLPIYLVGIFIHNLFNRYHFLSISGTILNIELNITDHVSAFMELSFKKGRLRTDLHVLI